jgi:hypothetical protein
MIMMGIDSRCRKYAEEFGSRESRESREKS